MKTKTLLCTLLFLFSFSVCADQACEDEIQAIQTVLNSPPVDINPTALEEASTLFNQLTIQCSTGAAFADVATISQRIRQLLGMG